jgi:hypothetical protein
MAIEYKEVPFDVRVTGKLKVNAEHLKEIQTEEWASVICSFLDENEVICYLLRLLFMGVDINMCDGHYGIEGGVAEIVDIEGVENLDY